MTAPNLNRPKKLSEAIIAPVLVLTIVNVLNFADRTLLIVLAKPIKDEFALSDTQFGILSGIGFFAVYSFAGIIIGRLSDRMNRRNIIAVVLGLWSAMTLLCGLAQNFFQLIAARAFMGIGEAGCLPASISMISDYFDPKSRMFALSIYYMGTPIGVLLSFMVGSAIADHFGWRASFFALGLIGLLLVSFVFLLVREPVRGQRGEHTVVAASFRQAVAIIFSSKLTFWLIFANTFAIFGSTGIMQWISLYFIRYHAMSVREVGFIFGPMIALGMTFSLLLGGVTGAVLKGSVRRSLIVCISAVIIMAVCYFFALWLPDKSAALVAFFLATLLSLVIMPIGSGTVQNICAPHVRATAVAITVLCSGLVGTALGPFVVGFLSDALMPELGPQSLRYSLTIVTGIMLFIGAFGFERARRESIRLVGIDPLADAPAPSGSPS